MKVQAHRGLPVNEVAADCAAKGHTSVIPLGEARELELDQDLHSTKLTAAGCCSDNPAEVNMRWSKALQRRLAANEAWMVVRKFIDKGNRTSQFMLRPGEGRWCLGKALRTVSGSAATILLKAVSKTLKTNQVLHEWYAAKTPFG